MHPRLVATLTIIMLCRPWFGFPAATVATGAPTAFTGTAVAVGGAGCRGISPTVFTGTAVAVGGTSTACAFVGTASACAIGANGGAAMPVPVFDEGRGSTDMSMVELLMAKNLRKQVLVGIVIKIGVQFSGIDAIFYYSTIMFRHAKVADPQMATTLLSLVNLAMTFIAMAIMEKAGRRLLIMVTWCGMCAGFFIIFLSSTFSEMGLGGEAGENFLANLEVVSMVCIIISFAVGVGNVEGFIISEIMPVYAKDTLMSIGQPLNWIANLTVSTLFPILFQAMGRYAYLIFVGLTFFFGWFTHTKLPETKGKTIAQVTKDFERY